MLKEWIPSLVKSDKNAPIDEQGLLPELKRAVIASNGKLTPNFEYINDLRLKNMASEKTMVKKTQEKKTEVDATASILH
jgi:alpha-aminoadipic semialdehyde synthase